jgi:hypothetical protein
MMENAARKARPPITTILIISQKASNLCLKTFIDILLKYHKLRNTDSKTRISSVVWRKNLGNDILKNPNEICPGTDNGGVIFTRNNAQKKFFFI